MDKFRAAWWLQLKKEHGYNVIPIFAKDKPTRAGRRWRTRRRDCAMARPRCCDPNDAPNLIVIDLDIHVAAARNKMLDLAERTTPGVHTRTARAAIQGADHEWR